MKLCLCALSAWLAYCQAYIVVPPTYTHSHLSSNRSKSRNVHPQRNISRLHNPTTSLLASTTDFGSDFGSAMPEKPELSLEEKMNQSADDFIINMESVLGDTEPPPELQALKVARERNASVEEITLRVYELMIERGMRYDENPDGGLTPTDFDIPNNLDVPEVQEEFAHLYRYGMMLMNRGLLTADQVKHTVIERLIKRTGLTPQEFDEWLGY
ncbi:hypothetical protein IV203_036613 [Nitzschia inconspicua]|uniref:Uncharacterized protein n=1 Tax=Nitzschia inconspicua TaxID=303405 RepID=A0A9K3PVN7_9STRA|nr:hypothetical protein IV203_036613 [Nitzschia inconspicua]